MTELNLENYTNRVDGTVLPASDWNDVFSTIQNKVNEIIANPSDLIGDNGINTSNITTSAVTTEKIASEAVTRLKIADGAVNDRKLSVGSVQNASIMQKTINLDRLSDGIITLGENTDFDIFANATNNTFEITNDVGEAAWNALDKMFNFSGGGSHSRISLLVNESTNAGNLTVISRPGETSDIKIGALRGINGTTYDIPSYYTAIVGNNQFDLYIKYGTGGVIYEKLIMSCKPLTAENLAAVLYDRLQSLTDAQKQQARNNIGAILSRDINPNDDILGKINAQYQTIPPTQSDFGDATEGHIIYTLKSTQSDNTIDHVYFGFPVKRLEDSNTNFHNLYNAGNAHGVIDFDTPADDSRGDFYINLNGALAPIVEQNDGTMSNAIYECIRQDYPVSEFEFRSLPIGSVSTVIRGAHKGIMYTLTKRGWRNSLDAQLDGVLSVGMMVLIA